MYKEEEGSSVDEDDSELSLEEAEKTLKEFDEQENQFIFVANGRVIHAIKFAKEPKLEGMYQKFITYNMNIVAAQNIDKFLYCLVKSHVKIIDSVPVNQIEGGVLIYALD